MTFGLYPKLEFADVATAGMMRSAGRLLTSTVSGRLSVVPSVAVVPNALPPWAKKLLEGDP